MADGPESLSPLDEPAGGVTRRQALKRGALLGGALAWAAPVVQVIGMQPAFAQVPSGFCRIEFTGGNMVCVVVPQSVCDCFNAGPPTLRNLIRCLEGVDPGEIFDC